MFRQRSYGGCRTHYGDNTQFLKNEYGISALQGQHFSGQHISTAFGGKLGLVIRMKKTLADEVISGESSMQILQFRGAS